MLYQIVVETILEKELESYDSSSELTQEETEKVMGFFSAMELQRRKSTRSQRRQFVNGQFSKSVRKKINPKKNYNGSPYIIGPPGPKH